MDKDRIETYPTRDALTAACTALIENAVRKAIETKNHAALILTGGSSPGPVYDLLAQTLLDWGKVTATLSDDRWVDPKDPLSNDLLIRTRLQTGLAASLGFVPLKYPAASLDAGAAMAAEALNGLAPFDVTLLGMGDDGHIASLFPDDPIATYALDPNASRLTVGVAMSGLPPFVPRISLTLPAMLDTALVILLVTGQAKRDLIQRVLDEPAYDLPVAALLRQSAVPVRILWAL